MDSVKNAIAQVALRAPTPLRLIAGRLLRSWSRKLIPDGLVWARVEGGAAEGLWMELNPRTGHDYLKGVVEPEVQATLVEYVKPGMTFCDIGANIGFFSLIAALLVGEQGKVFSFEPDDVASRRLERNVQRNVLGNVAVIKAAIWSETGSIGFVASDGSSPDRGLGRVGNEGKPIECVSMDDFALRAGPCHMIKCDVEGAEVEVFKGAQRLLALWHPIILCEMHSSENETALRECLGRAGYRLRLLDATHLLAVSR